MAEASLTFLLENLQKLLVDQVHLISGAENELKQLQNELGTMKAYLKDLASKREKDESSREFERQIREVFYEAEDTIDSYVIQAAAAKQKNIVARALNPKQLSLAKDVRCLRQTKVKPIIDSIKSKSANRQIPGASDTIGEKTQDKLKKSTPSVREDNVVGFDGVAETLIRSLKEESEQLQVISITGMGGIGKTTLARKLYHDLRIEFPTRIWVNVSQEFNRRDVSLTILEKFTHQDMSSKKDDELFQLVKSYLKNAKFLLILDDVWTAETWKDIHAALPMKNSSGKVLITSRLVEVALEANCKGVHQLGFLDSNQSWELLQLEVFGKLDYCPSHLEVLGKDIANNCGGIPLAIVVIGGILKNLSLIEESHEMTREWRRVATSVNSHFNNDKEKRMENFISMSYNNLPHDLRDCFLYLGMFPEDFKIPAWKLIRLWIAEGFIQKKPENSLEEVAEDNLKDLIRRSLVMVGQTKAEGRIKTCHIHDMIRKFCKNEAKKQNFLQEMKMSKEGVFDPPVSEIKKYRRLSIHSNVLDFLNYRPKGERIRSFLCFSKEAITLPNENIPLITDAFNFIRVLDANPIKFSRFPINLKKLNYLRYIALSGDDFRVLPKDISMLWNLQTIRVDTKSRKFEIIDMWKMMQLRHFKTKAAIIVNKPGKDDNGKYLQTLGRLSAQCCTPDVFNKARNLKTLGIRGNLAIVFDAKCLEKLNLLEKLKLVYDVFPHAASQKPLPSLPPTSKNTFPPNLRILTISATFLAWKHMSTLAMIDTLEVLKLKDKAFMGKCWDIADGGAFPSLQVLYIARTDLEFWTASNDAFPKLRCLVLKDCEELDKIPFGLVKSLEILDIECVTKSAVASARKIEQQTQQRQAQQRSKRGGFKLLIAPGDES